MAGRIPQEFINDLLARVDIVDVIDRRVTLKKAGKNYQARCPFHDEKTPSFSVSPDKQFYYCFGCQASGTALTFLLEYEHLDFVEAVETLASSVGLEVPREGNQAPRKDYAHLYRVMERAERFFRDELKRSNTAIEYVKGRGVAGITARDFGLGYAPAGWQNLRDALSDVSEEVLLEAGLLTRNDNGRTYDRFRERIMFPIRDTRGRVIAFGGRVLSGDDGPKYLNSPETPIFNKGRELYGLFEARTRVRSLDRLILVEGYLDVVALAQAGVPNGVATLGTSVSRAHFESIFRYVDEAVSCFDGDRAGRQAAWRALEAALPVLTEGKQLKFVFLPDGEDPDSFVAQHGKAAFLAHLDNATGAVDYLFDTLSQGLDLDSIDDRAKLAGLARPHIETVQEGILRQFMQRRLDTLTGSAITSEGSRASPVRVTQARPRSAKAKISERLLSILLRHPEVVDSLSDEQTAICRNLQVEGLLTAVLRYTIEHRPRSVDEVLARWAGEPEYDTLVRLAQRPLAFEGDALVQDFVDGVSNYLRQRTRNDRSARLREMREEGTPEALKAWLAETSGQSDTEGG